MPAPETEGLRRSTNTGPIATGAAPRRERTALVLAALALLGLALRASFLLGAEVDFPLRGDIVDYWNYAWNLLNHGVFSRAAPAAAIPSADAWRSPGYPLFLAACQWFGGPPAQELALAQWTQVLLGSLMVPLGYALGRRWLSRNLALAAAFAIAVWPHLVVFSSTLLGETLFGLLLLLAAWLASIAQARDRAGWGAAAGLVAGLGALVNPVLLLFPPAFAALLAWRRQFRVAGAYLVVFACVAGAWEWRNAGLPAQAGAAGRAQTNLVQGSWPLYHDAANDRLRNEIAAAYFAGVEEEVALMQADPAAGRAQLLARLRAEPGEYLRWYLLEKPWLLWDWDVRIGWGDVYFLETKRSPFERVPVLAALHATARAFNPLVFALALLAAVLSLPVLLRLRSAPADELARLQVGLLCCYFTAVHVVLQAEPRYAVAYRPLELLLAVSAFAFAAQAWRRRRGLA